MVGHHHKLVKQESLRFAFYLEDVHQQSRHALLAEEWITQMRNGCDKECADFLGSVSHKSTSAKALDSKLSTFTALKGRSSTGSPR